MCVYCHMSKKIQGRSVRIFFFFLFLSAKPEIVVPSSRIRFRYFIFEISGKMTNYAVFLPSLLSISTKSQQFNKIINKTLLLVKQQKQLSEFCVKIHRVASKNQGRSGDHKHTYFFFWPNVFQPSKVYCFYTIVYCKYCMIPSSFLVSSPV